MLVCYFSSNYKCSMKAYDVKGSAHSLFIKLMLLNTDLLNVCRGKTSAVVRMPGIPWVID